MNEYPALLGFDHLIVREVTPRPVEIVKRSDQAKDFQVIPKRWIVERTLAQLIILATYRKGRRITREPFEEE